MNSEFEAVFNCLNTTSNWIFSGTKTKIIKFKMLLANGIV